MKHKQTQKEERMGIFSNPVEPSTKKVRFTRKDDKLLLQLLKKKWPLRHVATVLGRTIPSINARLRFFRWAKSKYGVSMEKALERYNYRNKGIMYVSPSKWTEQADREFVKAHNKGSFRFDRRAQRRKHALFLNLDKISGTHGGFEARNEKLNYELINPGVNELMMYVHQKVVPVVLYSKVIQECRRLIKENNGLKELKSQLAKLAA
jgi:hypothetical protein